MAAKLALQLAGKPSFNSCEEYINSLLSKVRSSAVCNIYQQYGGPFIQGERTEGEVQPSLPLAENLISFIVTERNHLQDIRHALQTQEVTRKISNTVFIVVALFTQSSEGNTVTKKDEIVLSDPVGIKVKHDNELRLSLLHTEFVLPIAACVFSW